MSKTIKQRRVGKAVGEPPPVIDFVKNARNVLSVRFDKVVMGWSQTVLLSSDRHHDALHSDRELEKKHLDRAKELGALIIDVGDLFDAMQGRYDPRRSYEDLRDEFKGVNYYNLIVNDAAKFYAPYAKNWLLMGRGNHDQGVLNHTNNDILSNLAYKLNTEAGGSIQVGGFGGWVRFLFAINGTLRTSVNLKYHHGTGGANAPVTRGTIHTNRQAVYLPDADIVVNGHNHEGYYVAVPRERLSDKGVVHQDIQHHVRTPGYHIDYGDGASGWWIETGGSPKSRGCAWLTFSYSGNHKIGVSVTHDLV